MWSIERDIEVHLGRSLILSPHNHLGREGSRKYRSLPSHTILFQGQTVLLDERAKRVVILLRRDNKTVFVRMC